jgi:hypothetical protein
MLIKSSTLFFLQEFHKKDYWDQFFRERNEAFEWFDFFSSTSFSSLIPLGTVHFETLLNYAFATFE